MSKIVQPGERFARDFFEQDTLTVCRELLGSVLYSVRDDIVTAGRIVEAEAYCGPEDLGAHTRGGRRTARNEAMYGEKGHAYIYLIYGMHWCINVVSGPADKPQACLIRALEPVAGLEIMRERVNATERAKDHELCRGPGKLCKAMALGKEAYGADLRGKDTFLVPGARVDDQDIGFSPRIGIDYAKEYKDVPWRMYVRGSKAVSGPAKWRQ